METLTTNKEGYAESKELQPGTYTVHQIKGTENYTYCKDFDVTINDGDHSKHEYEKENIGSPKLRISKTMAKNKISKAEVGAAFTVLDAKYTKDIEKQDLGNSEKESRISIL